MISKSKDKELQMQASVQYRQQERSFGMVTKEKEDDLALFLEMRNIERERNNILHFQSYDRLDDQSGSKPGSSEIFKMPSTLPVHKTRADEFLNSDNNKTDYDWLLTPPSTPLFPSLERKSNTTFMGQIGVSNARPTVLNSRLANPPAEPASRSNITSREPTFSSSSNSSSSGNRRPPSSGGATSTDARHATPTGRPTLPATTKPVRPSTPTLRSTLPSGKPAAPAMRSLTPTRSTLRSSTPTARPSVPVTSKSMSRSATPTRRPSIPSNVPSISGPPVRSSSVTKSGSMVLKNPVPSRGTSPTVKSRPWNPSDMPGFSHDAPPNLRTSMPERPASASRGRPGAPSTRSSSSSNGRARRQSCSPSRGQVPNGTVQKNGSSVPAIRRTHSNGSDTVSPVMIGTKMVERIVNMRKLAPPKQDDQNKLSGKPSSSQENSGFGRTISKKSIDMALRHMDIRRSIPGNLHPLVTSIPASSVYSVRSGSTKSWTISVSDSPLATSSNASSEPSVNNNSHCLDGSEVDDNDIGSERGRYSPASQHGR